MFVCLCLSGEFWPLLYPHLSPFPGAWLHQPFSFASSSLISTGIPRSLGCPLKQTTTNKSSSSIHTEPQLLAHQAGSFTAEPHKGLPATSLLTDVFSTRSLCSGHDRSMETALSYPNCASQSTCSCHRFTKTVIKG